MNTVQQKPQFNDFIKSVIFFGHILSLNFFLRKTKQNGKHVFAVMSNPNFLFEKNVIQTPTKLK